MSQVALSSGVRNALSAIQASSAQAQIQQTRLATGKKVNSALDNPTNFFTASGLSDRGNDLSALLDQIGLGVKTLQAADKAITAITKLVEAAQGVARQALSTTDTTARAAFATSFADLRTQIDQLAKDADYNGVNLLGGTTVSLKLIFNEKTGTSQSSLTLTGVDGSASGLGIAAAAGSFATDANIQTSIDALIAAKTTLRTNASSFGANLSVVQNRQDYTKGLIDTLQQGADGLVLADTNEEGAKLLALNTRQQLGITALTQANQAEQGVLRLFA
jgi:flagellin